MTYIISYIINQLLAVLNSDKIYAINILHNIIYSYLLLETKLYYYTFLVFLDLFINEKGNF